MTVSGNDYDCVETCISKKIDIYEEFMINYKLDYQNTIKITEEREVIYTISSKHRGHNKNKSNWSIKMPIEVSLFKSALKKGYEDKTKYTAWNLYIVNEEISEVGYTVDKERVKIAKFVDSNHNEIWHGYPANYIKNNQDIPSVSVLNLWYNEKIITLATMRKIRGGQPCNL